MYFANVPRVALYGGIFHTFLRAAISSSETATDSSFFSASMVTISPLRISQR
jgi:hypothetical protein